ncbi:zinc/iron-chelating domain-containing protein [Halobacteriales archaeon QS_6_64_34]|nr:MAG: zinc/iron-chelating domain-containing protein [Halobacteriales archaeon QS_6_64_34]
MDSLETELERARELDVSALADAIETIGFECTRCGACCKAADEGCGDGSTEPADGGTDPEPHTATVFPDEIRRLQAAGDYDFRDVVRPMPYGIEETPDGPQGETFEWALQTDDCGDCTFYDESDGVGACTVHEDRPLICKTYPFSIGDVDERQHNEDGGLGTTEPMGGIVDQEGMVRAHECEGLRRDISREDAEELAAALKERAIRELEEAIGVRDNYEPTDLDGVVVHDSEGQKRPDGIPLDNQE